MRHCCEFKADDVYFLKDTNMYTLRRLSIGFCPICSKPIAELNQQYFNGDFVKCTAVGIEANELVHKNKDDIIYSVKELNYAKIKSKPFGWKYGVNRASKKSGKEVIKQYAYDFYGNKELIKTVG